MDFKNTTHDFVKKGVHGDQSIRVFYELSLFVWLVMTCSARDAASS